MKKPVYCSLAQLTSFHTLRGDKGQILGRLKVFAFDEQMNDIKKTFQVAISVQFRSVVRGWF